MSEVRLDAATLEHVAKLLAAHLALPNVAHETPAEAALRAEVRDAINEVTRAVESAAAVERGQPPRLSSLVAACEGTALGEPAWEAIDDVIVAHFDSGAAVHIDTNIPARATMWTSDAYERLSLPEIRAALEALAKDAKP